MKTIAYKEQLDKAEMRIYMAENKFNGQVEKQQWSIRWNDCNEEHKSDIKSKKCRKNAIQ